MSQAQLNEFGVKERIMDATKTYAEMMRDDGDQMPLPTVDNKYTPPDDYCVYMLYCESRYDDVTEIAMKKWGYVPRWVHKSTDYTEHMYVGAHSNFKKRLEQHIDGEDEAARFTQLYKPTSGAAVFYFSEWDAATDCEENMATVMRNLDYFVPPVRHNRI